LSVLQPKCIWPISGQMRFLPVQFRGYLPRWREAHVIECAPGFADARHDPENSCPSRTEEANLASTVLFLFTKTRVIKYLDK